MGKRRLAVLDFCDVQDISNPEAEAAILGCAMWMPQYRADVLHAVSREELYDQKHRVLYDVLTALEAENAPADDHTIYAACWRVKDQIGGLEYVGELIHKGCCGASIPFFSRKVRESAARKGAIEATIRLHGSKDIEADDLRKLAERAFTVADAGLPVVSLGDLTNDAIARIEARRSGAPEESRLGSPWPLLNFILRGGPRNGTVTILAARASVGKSAVALAWSLHAARSRRVLFVSLEMGHDELTERALGMTAGVDTARIGDAARMSVAELSAVMGARDALLSLPWEALRQTNVGPRDLWAMAKPLRGHGCLFVDYVQLMTAPDKRVGREQQVAEISRAFKLMAMELQIPLVVVAQLNRPPKGQKNPTPMVQDLRESGALENDADNVLMLHRQDWQDATAKASATSKVELLVRKQRGGPLGTVLLNFDKAQQSITQIDTRPATEPTRRRDYTGGDD